MKVLLKKNNTIAAFTIIIIFSVIVVAIFSAVYFKQRDDELEKYHQNAKTVLQLTDEALNTWIEDQIRVAQTIAEDSKIIDACINPQKASSLKAAENYLKSVHAIYPYYENLPLAVKLEKPIKRSVNGSIRRIDNFEFIIDSVDGETVGRGGLDYSYVKEIVDGKPYFISEIYPSIYRGNPIFVISVPIIKDDLVIGIAIVSPKMDAFSDKFINSVKLGETGFQFFVDGRGKIIAHSEDGGLLEHHQRKLSKSFVDNLVGVSEDTYIDHESEDGQSMMATKVQLSSDNIKYDWYMIVVKDNKEIFKSSTDLLNRVWVIILVLVVMFAVLIHLIMHINNEENRRNNLVMENHKLEKLVTKRTAELEEKATRDSLTGLYNHKYAYDYLSMLLAKSTLNDNITIVMMDLDHFKEINDTYGHRSGDEVLEHVATRLKAYFEEDVLLCRYGGEEFLLVLEGKSFSQSIKQIEILRKNIDSVIVSDQRIKITASFGMAIWQGETPGELVETADKLLYKAKSNGRNRIEH